MHTQSLSRVWLFATPLTVVHQVPLSMRFPGQEYWSGIDISFSMMRWLSYMYFYLFLRFGKGSIKGSDRFSGGDFKWSKVFGAYRMCLWYTWSLRNFCQQITVSWPNLAHYLFLYCLEARMVFHIFKWLRKKIKRRILFYDMWKLS